MKTLMLLDIAVIRVRYFNCRVVEVCHVFMVSLENTQNWSKPEAGFHSEARISRTEGPWIQRPLQHSLYLVYKIVAVRLLSEGS